VKIRSKKTDRNWTWHFGGVSYFCCFKTGA